MNYDGLELGICRDEVGGELVRIEREKVILRHAPIEHGLNLGLDIIPLCCCCNFYILDHEEAPDEPDKEEDAPY